MLLRSSIATLALALLILFPVPGEARHIRHHHHVDFFHHPEGSKNRHDGCQGTTYDNDGRSHCHGGFPSFSPSPLEGRGGAGPRTHVRRGGIGNNESSVSLRGGYARVCVLGHCGTVAADLKENFRGLYAEFLAMGYNIGSPGCLSSGHMRHSLHHTGRACDLFNQVARNRTALRQPSPSVQIEVAARHGLTSGCAWRSPDCGHFDVSGIGGSGPYARARRARHIRVALRR